MKPSYQRLIYAVTTFLDRNRQAGFNVLAWQESERIFRNDLRNIGIDPDHFDWTK